jgi:hypothetical protein
MFVFYNYFFLFYLPTTLTTKDHSHQAGRLILRVFFLGYRIFKNAWVKCKARFPFFELVRFRIHCCLFFCIPPLFAQRPQLYMTCPSHLARGAFGFFQRNMKCSVRPAVGKGGGSWYPDIQTPGQHHILDCLIFFEVGFYSTKKVQWKHG